MITVLEQVVRGNTAIGYNCIEGEQKRFLLQSEMAKAIKDNKVDTREKYNIKYIGHGKKTNAELALRYKLKEQLICPEYKLKIRILSDSDVKLLGIECIQKISNLILPKFLTEYTEKSLWGIDVDLITIRSRFKKHTRLISRIHSHKLTIKIEAEYSVTDISDMITECEFLKEVTIKPFNTENLEDISYLFHNCYKLEICNLPILNAPNLKAMAGMFCGCSNLEFIDLSNILTSNKLIDTSCLFSGCSKLKSINFGSINTLGVKTIKAMFCGCSSLINIDMSNIGFHILENMDSLFYECINLEDIKLPDLSKNKILSASNSFFGCSRLQNIDLNCINFTHIKTCSYMFAKCSLLNEIRFPIAKCNLKDAGYMFSNCESLTALDLSNLECNNLTTVECLAMGCSRLHNIRFFSNVGSSLLNMSSAFKYCESLEHLDFSGCNIECLEHIDSAFYGCINIHQIDLRAISFKNIEYMENLFYSCTNLEKVDFRQEEAKRVVHTNKSFKNCINLYEINLAFIQSRIKDMSEMFMGCSKLQKLDISGVTVISSDNINKCFYKCISLNDLKSSNQWIRLQFQYHIDSD